MASMAEAQPGSDATISQSILAELKWEPRIIRPEDIAIAVTAGVVTLAGHVHSYFEKDAAEEAVKRIHGVKAVANDIEVKTTWNRTDSDLAQEAVHQLQNLTGLPVDRIQITVRNGWITLEGDVLWQYQRTLAESLMRQMPGVAGVTDGITVTPAGPFSAIQGKIEEGLRKTPDLETHRISVDVAGTAVKLTGSVRSREEKQEVERVAWAAAGVTRVESHLIIAP